MAPPVSSLQIPATYADLSFREIKIENHPLDSTAVTPIQILTLYRPGHGNAFTHVMMDEIERAFATFDLDVRVKCLVVTGHGSSFCVGADLGSMFKKTAVDGSHHRDEGGRAALAIYHCGKPVIGALNGAAVGIGITMTLPMTIRLAPEKAKIGFVFTRRGLIMEAASSFFLPRLIGHSKAMHVVATGSIYPASSPLLSGLFSETLPSGTSVLERALTIAEDIVEHCSNLSYVLNRDLMWRNPNTAEGTHLLDSRIIHDLFETPENKEGVQSFREKRKPNFKGTLEHSRPHSYPWWKHIDVRNSASTSKGTSKL